ncbi:MAG: efflux RND transporter permease subunit, partial [Planctomycetota bacterium]
MDLIRLSILRPVTVTVGVLLVILAGVISLGLIPIQLTPSLDNTVVSVQTFWEGASPLEIEQDIVHRQEEKLKGLSNLKKMTSQCTQEMGMVKLEFFLGTSKESAMREASDRLREVIGYPDNAEEPIVRASDPESHDYIAWIVATCSDPDFDIRQLQDFFDDRVKPELERVDGLSEIQVLGGNEREIQVQVDTTRLAQYGLTLDDFVQKLRTQNRSASAGQLVEGKLDVRVRSVGRYDSLDQIENTLLSEPGSPVVYVKDVGAVVQSHKEARGFVRSRGQTVLAINAQREVGSNVLAVMEDLKQRVRWANEILLPAESQRMGLNGELELAIVYDQTVYIEQALQLVQRNILFGGVLAVTVLLVFLRSLRSTLVIALAIPVSVVGAFAVMSAMGRNINVISLAGMAFAIGMVVDNAIVVLENIDRQRRLGATPFDAAYRGTRQVWGAILASTLTTVAVFAPVLMIREEAGQLFRDIALAICAAVSLSLLISVTVIPSAAAAWLKPRKTTDTLAKSHNPFTQALRMAAAATGRFAETVYLLSASWFVRLAIICGIVTATVYGAARLMPDASYLPGGNQNLVFAMLMTPPGYNVQQNSSLGERVEARLEPYWQAFHGQVDPATLPPAVSFNPMTGEAESVRVDPINDFFFVNFDSALFMGASSADPQRVAPLAALMNQSLQDLPATFGFAMQMPLFMTSGAGTGSGINLELSGPDLEEVNAAAATMMGVLGAKWGYHAIQPTPMNFALPGPELTITRDPIKDAIAAEMGVDQNDINLAARIFGDGAIIGDFILEGDTIDISVRAIDAERGDAAWLANAPVASPGGQVVPLSTLRNITRSTAPQQISRVEQQRAVILNINLPEQYPLEQAMGEVRQQIVTMRDTGAIAPSVQETLAGSAAKLTEVKRSLLGAWNGPNFDSVYSLVTSKLFLSLLVVFLVMAALFESWLYPLVIMFSVPLAAVGGLIGLQMVRAYVPNQQFDVLTMLGFVILIGIVVNNAILIVHKTLNLLRGLEDND